MAGSLPPIMRWPVRVALTAGSGTWLLALAAAAAYVATRHGFGSGDLAAFAFWTAFLGALMAALAAPVLRRTARRGRVARAALAALAGLAAGLAFTMAVAFALGPMVLAFSFPILPIWTGACAVAPGVVGTLRAGRPPGARRDRPGGGLDDGPGVVDADGGQRFAVDASDALARSVRAVL